MMTDSTTKSAKSVAPETVRLFEIIGFGKTNEEEYKSKVQNIMEVTGCEENIAILTLHDCNDENEAIQRLLDSNAGPTEEGWVTKKKDRKKKSCQETFENESADTPKAYVTDGHSGEPDAEGRRGVKSREKDRDSYGGWKERKSGPKESGDSWDGEETTEMSKPGDSSRTERDRPGKNGYSNKSRQRYRNDNYDRRDQEGDRNEDRHNSRVFVNRRNERYQQDGEERYPRERNERYGRDSEDQNKEKKNRNYKERRSYDNSNRGDRNQWENSRYSRDLVEQETDDRPRRREKRSDKEPIIFDSSTNRSSKTTELNGDFYSREDADEIDWDNPVLSTTDWGAEDTRKEYEEDVDEDKRIEAILSEGWEFCNPNFDHEDVQEAQTSFVPSKSTNESAGISTSHSPPIRDNLHPIYSPQTTSLPTPSASIPESRPPSHHQAMGDMFSRLDKMNIKRKIRSKIPQAPVELPASTVDSYDIQFGNVVSLPPAPQEQDDFKFTDSPSPVNDKTFSNANFHDSDLSTSNEQSSPPPAPKSNERPTLQNSPPPKSDLPLPSRSPVPQEKQAPLSAPPPHQTAAPTSVSAPPNSQPPPHYHQHLNRQNERKGNYSESSKMHHHGGMAGNSVKMQQHPQMAPVNSIDQQTGMPYMMTGPMGSVGLQPHTAPNSLPATTMSNIPRGLGKNYQPPLIYNTPGGQFSMMPNYYYEQEMIRLMSQSNNPASNMVKDQNSNPVFPNNESKFHEPTSPANAQSGIQGQNVYLPFPGYGFFPNIFPVMPKSNTYPNPVTAAGQTPFQTPPPLPPNIAAIPDQHNEYKANFSNVQQKTGAMAQATDIQNIYKSFEQKSAIPFGFGYPMAQYMTPQMMPPLSQQQPQYNPNMLLQQPHDTQRPKW